MRMRFALLLYVLASPAAAAVPPADLADTQLASPAQEARAKALMATIRCLVCEGQSISDSDADMAGDMRAMIRARVAQGEQPAAIRRWLIARYGNWVSYDPPLDAATLPLWTAPLLFVAGGAWLVRRRFRRRR